MARGPKKNNNGNGRRLATPQSVDQVIWSICDIMRRGNCAGAMQYVPELTWVLFLRILDEKEEREEQEAEALGVPFRPSLEAPYRWRDWAAPPPQNNHKDTAAQSRDENLALPYLDDPGGEEPQGWKRAELQNAAPGSLFSFVNTELLPHLKGLKNRPNATPRQKVISEIMTGVERVRIDTERNFLDVLDKVHQLTTEAVDPTHVFTLSQVYEGLLLKMGEKGNDGGQFFTPRQVIKAMVRVVDPKIDETVYDPCCGTGGFLAQSYEHIDGRLGEGATAGQLETLKQRTFYGREKENLIYPIALANLVLHGIDRPNLWHGNTLTGQEIYGGLFDDAPPEFDVILTNPPFGGKEGKEAQTNFDYATSATQALFLQHVLRSLREGGRCGIVLDEGLLFRTNEDGFVKTKRKLLHECDLWCIVSLPAGVFTAAGAGVKTNLLFFTKGGPTRTIWYYDLSDVKVRKKSPLMPEHFEELFQLLGRRADSERSWTVDIEERRQRAAEEARPFREQSAARGHEAAQWNERLKELKRAAQRDHAALAEAEAKLAELKREARDLANRAKEIEDAVYDLKAVNPHRKPDTDTRTPEELIAFIEAQGREIAEALAALRRHGHAPEASGTADQ
jgi:type I restriction enzyme M protein